MYAFSIPVPQFNWQLDAATTLAICIILGGITLGLWVLYTIERVKETLRKR